MSRRTYRVRELDEDGWTEIAELADDSCEAAELACARWLEGGRWAGEKFPLVIEVLVDAGDGEPKRYDVEPQWDVSFYARGAR